MSAPPSRSGSHDASTGAASCRTLTTANAHALACRYFAIVVLLVGGLGSAALRSQSPPGRHQRGMSANDLLKVEQVEDAAVDPSGSLVALVIQRARSVGEPTYERAYGGNVRGDVVVMSSSSGQVVVRTAGKSQRTGYWNPVWSPSGDRLAMLALRGDTLSLCVWLRGHDDVTCERNARSLDYLTRLSVGSTEGDSHRVVPGFLWLSDSVLAVALLPRGRGDLQVVRSHHVADSIAAAWARQAGGERSTESVLDAPLPLHHVREVVEVRFWNLPRDSTWSAFSIPYFNQGSRSVVLSRDSDWAAVLADQRYSAPGASSPFGMYNRKTTMLGMVRVASDASIWWAPAHPYTPEGAWRDGTRRFAVRVKRSYDEDVARGSRIFVLDPLRRTVDTTRTSHTVIDTSESGGQSVARDDGSSRGRPGDHVIARAPDGSFSIVRRFGPEGTTVWLIPSTGATPRLLLSLNAHLASVASARRMLISYTTLAGSREHAVALLPPGFEPGARFPLVAWLYPGSIYSDTLNANWLMDEDDQLFLNPNVLAGSGYVVLLPSMPLDAAGSAGDPCLRVRDGVSPAIDTMIAIGIADSARLGVIGHSFGGYAVNCIVGQSHRFRAAVSNAGIADMTSLALQYYPNSRYTDSPDMELRWVETGEGMMGAPPWRDAQRYMRNSPILYADSVETPVLITTGDNDFMAQSEEWFNALYRAGKRARLIRYWGEGHLLSSPANVLRNWNEILSWFDTYLRRTEHPVGLTGGS